MRWRTISYTSAMGLRLMVKPPNATCAPGATKRRTASAGVMSLPSSACGAAMRHPSLAAPAAGRKDSRARGSENAKAPRRA